MDDTTKEGRLGGVLVDMRKHKDKMQELVELLENKRDFTCYYSDKNQYQIFCEAYTITLLEQYVRDPDVREPMLASYQLLDDYGRLKYVRDRHVRYSERAASTNRLINSDWADPNDSLQDIEDKAIEKLVDQLTKDVANNKKNPGVLGLASAVVEQLKKQFPNGLPKKLPLPKPRYKEQNTTDGQTPQPGGSNPQGPKVHIGRISIGSLISIDLKSQINTKLSWIKIPVSCVVLAAIAALFLWHFYPSATPADEMLQVDEILVTEHDIFLKPNEIYQLEAGVLPTEAQGAPLSYVSSDTKVVTVSREGMLQVPESHEAGGTQTANITIQAENGVAKIKPVIVDFSVNGYDSLVENIDNFKPDFLVEAQIRLAGTDDWRQTIEAEIGDLVEINIQYQNLSDFTNEDVMVRDILPTNLTYIPGSTKLYNTNHPTGVPVNQDKIATTGINIGTYEAGANAHVRFTAKVVDATLEPGFNTLVSWSQACVNGVTLQGYTAIYLYKNS